MVGNMVEVGKKEDTRNKAKTQNNDKKDVPLKLHRSHELHSGKLNYLIM